MEQKELKKLSTEDLRALNHQIVTELTFRNTIENFRKINQFKIGDTVKFDAGRRGIITIKNN